MIPDSNRFQPETRITELGPEFYDPVPPAEFPQTVLRYRNQRWAERTGLGALSEAEWLAHFGRFEPLPVAQPQPLALRYHGHQFRQYNPDLGDGRGFLYAQLREPGSPHRLLDLGTKGSGRTPWSRAGDGRLTLKGGVREVLATEMLEALGVPTSKSFSLIETGEDLVRGDEPSPTRSAVLTRLSHSHIRFGTFQRQAFHDKPDEIRRLTDYVVRNYYPELADTAEAERAVALLQAVVSRTATLVASWIAAGFVHGVLNTDNMNITGESFDYGPYRFLPKNDPNFTAAYFDQTGLYAFGRQPPAVFWNLQQLAGALSLIAPADPIVEALNGFSAAYRGALAQAMLTRLGVQSQGEAEDVELVNAAFRALAEGGEGLRWEPFFFDWFCGAASEARALNGVRGPIYQGEACTAFRRRLAVHAPHRPERLGDAYFAGSEPEELLYDEIEAIWAPIAERDDWGLFGAKLDAIGRAREAYAIAVP